MRVLCLKLLRRAPPYWAEIFTLYSPKVQYREPDLLFMEIHEVSHLFGGEQALLERVRHLCEQNLSLCSLAIGNTTYSAQLFALSRDGYISDPSCELDTLGEMPLSSLHFLEGLKAFDKVTRVQYAIDYFLRLGFKTLSDLYGISSSQMKERFGELGEQLYLRLHQIEKQILSPLIPQAPFTATTVCDHLIGHTHILLFEIEKTLRPLFLRLHARAFYSRDIRIRLLCEYSNVEHLFFVQPTRPHRDLGAFLKLIQLKCENLLLENPVKEIVIEVGVTPEKVEQLSLLEPTRFDEDKLVALLSQFEQVGIRAGYLHYSEEFLPENTWSLRSEYEADQNLKSEVEYAPHDSSSFKKLPVWAEFLKKSPRPTRLLRTPHRMNKSEFFKLQLLREWGVERVEDEWWNHYKERIYFLALNSKQQGLWIFLDLQADEYFLHGYFD